MGLDWISKNLKKPRKEKAHVCVCAWCTFWEKINWGKWSLTAQEVHKMCHGCIYHDSWSLNSAEKITDHRWKAEKKAWTLQSVVRFRELYFKRESVKWHCWRMLKIQFTESEKYESLIIFRGGNTVHFNRKWHQRGPLYLKGTSRGVKHITYFDVQPASEGTRWGAQRNP